MSVLTFTVKKDVTDDILGHIGGRKDNDLNEILQNFNDADDEIQTFDKSPYYCVENLPTLLCSVKNNFTILSINIQSIRAKFDVFQAFLSWLQDNNFTFSAICVQETWLHKNDDVSMFNIPGYQTIHEGKSCSEHGGLMIFLKDQYSYTKRDLYTTSDIWEGLFVDVILDDMNTKLTLGNIYRPPRGNNNNGAIESFLKEFRPVTNTLSKGKTNTVISGDFNINLLEINDRLKYQEFFDLMITQGFFPKIVFPTRFSKTRGTLIDQLFCKLSNATQKCKSGIIHSCMSDHLPYFTCIDINKSVNEVPRYVKITPNDETSINNFRDHIANSLLSDPIPNDVSLNPNDSYTLLEQKIKEGQDLYIKPKLIKFKRYKHKMSPWITPGILNSIKFRDRLYKKLRGTDPASTLHCTLQTNLRTYRSILQRNIRLAKIAYYGEKFNKNVSNTKETWSTINQLLNKCKNKKEFPNYFTIDNAEIRNGTDIANNFNTFFANIGPDLSEKISVQSDKNVNTFLKKKISLNFNFEPATVHSVKKIIDKLAPKSSTGHDSLSTQLLKSISTAITPAVTVIINQSLTTGIFPDRLKIAKVIPLFKKGDPHTMDNYRPISLLPAISKIFEKTVFLQVYNYFNSNDLFYKSQYGFRTGHSTELASLEFTDIIYQNLDRGKIPISVFLDLSKAFDTLDHSILLNKLQYYGIKGKSLDWFQSYLSNRCQFVDFDGTLSNVLPLTTGVPQGSILGPLLFIIYMNDIYVASDKFRAVLYADDSNMISTLCSFDISLSGHEFNKSNLSHNINRELNNISEWLSINKLSLNVKKTKFMLFHFRQRHIGHLVPNLEINGHEIERVTEFDFLGLTIDEHMNWNAHVQKISNKIARALGVISRLKRFLPDYILRTIYNTLVLPHLQYAILSWGFNGSRVIKLQKRAIRLIAISKYNAHTEPLFKKLNLLNFTDIFNLNALKFYYKHQNSDLPLYFVDMFSPVSERHNYNTRGSSHLQLSRTTTASVDKCVRNYIPKFVREAPPCILDKVHTHSIQGFTKYTKRYFIDKYNVSCQIEHCYVCNSSS